MLTTASVARIALRGLLFLLLANCVAAQVSISDCVADNCPGDPMQTDPDGNTRDQCCAYLRINDQTCCTASENEARQLYFNLIIGLSVVVFALIVIVLVIVCISVCCCCC